MLKGFSLINFLIVIGIIALAVLGYGEYQKNITSIQQQNDIKKETTDNSIGNKTNNTVKQNTVASSTKTKSNNTKNQNTTASSTKSNQPLKPAQPVTTLPPTNPATTSSPTNKNSPAGFYENKTYNFSLSYPPEWPLRIRSEESITLGSIPPKNCLGALTIEVSTDQSSNEIQQAKTEANKFPGIITFKEESSTLAGVSTDKLTLVNSLTKYTNVYILFTKYGFYYVIKYSEESANFVNQVNQILLSFKFTK